MNLNGTSINFPFRPDERGSVVTLGVRSELIAQAIADVIETRQGERVMMPDYGIPDFVFDVQDGGFAARIAYHIEQQVLKYVPLVKSISVKSETDENGRAVVSLQYTEVGEINAPKNLVFPVWNFTNDFSVANKQPITSVTDAPVPDLLAPSVPTDLDISVQSYSHISGSFTPSTDNVAVMRYWLRRATNAGFTANVVDTNLGESTEFDAIGLAASTTYYFKILAEDAAGNKSAYSTAQSVTTSEAPDSVPPSAPTGLSLTMISSTQIDGTFDPSTDNVGVTHYRLRRALNAGFTTGVVDTDLGTSTSFSATGLSASTTYYFKVLAEDAEVNQSAYCATQNATTSAPPIYPLTVAKNKHFYRAKSVVGLSNGDPCGNFPDLIGTAHATGTGAARPAYQSNFGDARLLFDGVDDYLGMTWEAFDNYCGFMVFDLPTKINDTNILGVPFFGKIAIVITNGGKLLLIVGSGYVEIPLGSAPLGKMVFYFERVNGSTSALKIRLNGVEVTGAGSGGGTSTSVAFGAEPSPGGFTNMNLYEFVVADDIWSLGEFSSHADYVMSEHGLTL